MIVSAYTASSFVPQRRANSILSTIHERHNVWGQPRTNNSRTKRNNRMMMFAETSGGIEQLQEYIELADTNGGMIAKQIRKSPSLFKLVGIASIPISAIAGFVMVPSRRIAAHVVGSVVTGIAGVIGKYKIDSMTQNHAKPAIVQALVDNGLENIETTSNAIKSIHEQFGLLDEDFEAICTDIYATYLLGMVKFNPIAKTSELKELEQLKQILSLDNLHVGEAHAQAATEWYRTTCLFIPEEEFMNDPSHPDRQAMDKLLFLSERAFRQNGETNEAFIFEMTRVARAVKLEYNVALDHVAATAEPFYARALKSTRSKLTTNQVSSDMLERARTSLGIDDDTAFDMHVATFNEEVRSLLGLENKISIDDDEDDNDDDNDVVDDHSSPQYQNDVKFIEGAIERVSRATLRCFIK
jgi:Chloroplast envelope transporter